MYRDVIIVKAATEIDKHGTPNGVQNVGGWDYKHCTPSGVQRFVGRRAEQALGADSSQ